MKTNAPLLRLRETGHPLLYEVNARVLLQEYSRAARSPLTLADLPDDLLDRWTESGFNAVWMMGVWTAGAEGVARARTHPGLLEEYRRTLPDLVDDDIIGSPYAVSGYTVSPLLGGDRALAALRERLAERNIALILDFVPNHTACDHPWVADHPEFYVQCLPDQADDQSWFRARTTDGEKTIAHGRDPFFPAWTDTAQLNVLHPGLRAATIALLKDLGKMCDGVRCDMAMLCMRDVFLRTWEGRTAFDEAQRTSPEFWSETIQAVRATHPGFMFIAEAYWDLEWPLQQLGFDYTYDKRLYDRLRHEGAKSVRDHLGADIEFQRKSLRFIENHDEPRAATVFSSESWNYAAALIVSTLPGMAFFHEGQLEGRTVKVPVQLRRRPDETASKATLAFYRRLLACLQNAGIRNGSWQMLDVRAAWHDNSTWENFLAYRWECPGRSILLLVVNYAPLTGQCYVSVPVDHPDGPPFEFRDLLGEATYVRDRAGLIHKGMYFDLPAYGFHLFSVQPARTGQTE